MKKILFKYPSRSRPEQFFAGLTSIYRHLIDRDNFHIQVTLDEDDASMNCPQVINQLNKSLNLSYAFGNSKSKIHAINKDLSDYGDIIICMSDDMRLTQYGFDNIIRQNMPDDLDYFLHFPENYKRAAVCTMSIMGRKYYDRTNYIYHPNYKSLWCDNEATEVAKWLNKYKYIDQAIYDHVHYSTGRAKKDTLYIKNSTYKTDGKVYEDRRSNNFGLHGDNPKLIIKYPTRGRVNLFAGRLDNIHSTIRTNNFKIIVCADVDDVEMNSSETRELISRYPKVELRLDKRVNKIHAVNRHTPSDDWDWVLVMSDDMKFLEFGWDQKMWEQIREEWPTGTDFFAHFADGYVNEKLPTMNICGREYYDRFGYIYHPEYAAVSCDAENMFVAMMLDRYKYFPEVYFHHIHPANTKMPVDRTYRENNEFGDKDTNTYFRRLRRLFDVTEPVMIPDLMKPHLPHDLLKQYESTRAIRFLR